MSPLRQRRRWSHRASQMLCHRAMARGSRSFETASMVGERACQTDLMRRPAAVHKSRNRSAPVFAASLAHPCPSMPAHLFPPVHAPPLGGFALCLKPPPAAYEGAHGSARSAALNIDSVLASKCCARSSNSFLTSAVDCRAVETRLDTSRFCIKASSAMVR